MIEVQNDSYGEEMMTMALQCLLDATEDKKIFIPRDAIEVVIKREGPIRALKFNKKPEGLEISFATSDEVLEEIQRQGTSSIIDKILDVNMDKPVDFGAERKGRF